MATNSFKPTSGNQSWDLATNWSLNAVPQSTDDVSIVGSPSSSLSVIIAASDPAYTVASLTESTSNTSAIGETLQVLGSLTVTGATKVTTGEILIGSNAAASLGAVTLSNSAEVLENGSGSSLSMTSLTAGSGTIGGSVLVSGGTATIGSVSGSISVDITSTSAIVGATGGTSFFGLSNGRLTLLSSGTSLGDTIMPSGTANYVDLQNVAYQTGETYSTTLVSSGSFNTYSVTLKTSAGQVLYTFQKVSGVGSFGAQMAPGIMVASDGGTGTLVTIACYAAGTRIAVPGGEALVCDLAMGDLVVTAAGAHRAVKWIGRRSYAGRFLSANRHLMPIRFRAGSLGGGLPRRDLMVSPKHAMFLEGYLVPADLLVNGTSVTREQGLKRIDYYHVELETHDVILAEGAPSETFLDDDSRGMFHNAHEYAGLGLKDADPDRRFCAPHLESGFVLDGICRAIAAVALEGEAAA